MMLCVPSGEESRAERVSQCSVSVRSFSVARCLPGMQVACALWLAESGLGRNCWFVSSLLPVLTLN